MIDGDMERGCAQASGNNEGTSTGTAGCTGSANNTGSPPCPNEGTGDLERERADASVFNYCNSTGTVGCSDSANNIGCSSQNASRKSENDVGCMVGGRQTLYEITNYVRGPKSLPHNANILQT